MDVIDLTDKDAALVGRWLEARERLLVADAVAIAAWLRVKGVLGDAPAGLLPDGRLVRKRTGTVDAHKMAWLEVSPKP